MSTLPLLLADAVIYHFPPPVNNGSDVGYYIMKMIIYLGIEISCKTFRTIGCHTSVTMFCMTRRQHTNYCLYNGTIRRCFIHIN